MRTSIKPIFLTTSIAAAFVVSLSAGIASAQVVQGVPGPPLDLDPSGSTVVNDQAPAAPTRGPSASSSRGGGDNDPNQGGASGVDYYGDYLDDTDNGPVRQGSYGVVPPTHTVRSGDTLWDLSGLYFSDAFRWPKVWGLNPEIEDPHRIYPGNIVRLRDGAAIPAAGSGDGKPSMARGTQGSSRSGKSRSPGFQGMAYVDTKELKTAATVVGSVNAKSLLSTGDSIYVSYEDGKVPEVGSVYSVYTLGKKLMRGGAAAGSYVLVRGTVEITFAKEGKQARGTILNTVNPIERGMKLGKLKQNFGDVEPVTNSAKVSGNIIDLIGPDELIGTESIVVLDRGSNESVEVGNRFLVLRRGDAYAKVLKPGSNVGQDDQTYPARAVGEIMVVQTGEQASLGVVTFSVHEFGVGDHVYMRKGQ